MDDSLGLALYQEMLRGEKVALLRWDLKTDRMTCDEAMAALFPQAVRYENYSSFLRQWPSLHPNDRKWFLGLLEFLGKPHPEYADGQKEHIIDFRLRDQSGEYRWLHARQIIHFEGTRPYFVTMMIRNTDSEHKKQEELRVKAERDPLTGLYNKGHSREVIGEALAVPDTKKALLVLDMDGFKKVNDNLGHLFGDAVISDMALSLADVFESSDILGRMGGDEFVVLMRDAESCEAITARCERLREELRRSFEYGDGLSLKVSGSIGIALSPEHGTDYDELFARADAALYEAKKRGRDTQVFYSPEIEASQRKVAEDDPSHQQRQSLLERPVEFIFRMLYETGNARTTVKTLLALFAKYFMVQRVVIYQDISGSWDCWFEWRTGGVLPTAEAHSGLALDFINGNYRQEIYGCFSECSDTAAVEGEMGEALQQKGIFAFLHAGIMNGSRRIGCVGFDDCRGPRVWTKKEHEVLKTFADILGTFLMDQMRYDMVRKGYWRLQRILDSLHRKIWVISAENGRVFFMNRRTRQALARRGEEERSCHKIATDSNRPCARCRFSHEGGNCPVARRLRCMAEERGFKPAEIEWSEKAQGLLYIEDVPV